MKPEQHAGTFGEEIPIVEPTCCCCDISTGLKIYYSILLVLNIIFAVVLLVGSSRSYLGLASAAVSVVYLALASTRSRKCMVALLCLGTVQIIGGSVYQLYLIPSVLNNEQASYEAAGLHMSDAVKSGIVSAAYLSAAITSVVSLIPLFYVYKYCRYLAKLETPRARINV